jgi:hypothetical protein
VKLAECPREAILDQIVGGAYVSGECSSVTPKARYLGFNAPVYIGHSGPLLISDRALGDRSQLQKNVSERCNPLMSRHGDLCKKL